MHDDDHDRGLQADLERWTLLASRRRALGWLATTVALPLVGCTDDLVGGGSTFTGEEGGSCGDGAIPEETAGPYPGDGSNGPDALALASIVRSDIRESIDGATGTAEGVVLTIRLTVLDADGCTPLAGHAVYLWHCDRDGNYSMYTAPNANYLRGVQETDEDGVVTFTTVFPGCYSGRWPHVHFEVYPSLSAATAASSRLATSQLALPEDVCDAVYAEDGYEASVGNLQGISLSSDNVFRDGVDQQMAAVSGSIADGLVAALIVPVDA